jgi:hypothetical protein
MIQPRKSDIVANNLTLGNLGELGLSSAQIILAKHLGQRFLRHITLGKSVALLAKS